MTDLDFDRARDQLLDPDFGFFKLDRYLGQDQVDAYRSECARFLETGPVFYARINTDTMCDYVQPRSHDNVDRTIRIYQFFHNQRSSRSDQLLKDAFEFRNEIEEPWLKNDAYRLERDRLQDYIIVTKYHPDSGMLLKHKDYEGNLDFPLIQFMILLSEPSVDYEKGDFNLFTRRGKKLSIQKDLNMRKGDALVFDKSLYHQVERTRGSKASDIGRWSVLIGARAKLDLPEGARKKMEISFETTRESSYKSILSPVRRLLRPLKDALRTSR